MKITEITYSRGQTLQLRQFEPVNVHFSAKAEVDGDLIRSAFDELKNIVDMEVQIQVAILEGNSGSIARAGAKVVIEKVKAKEESEANFATLKKKLTDRFIPDKSPKDSPF